MDDCSGVKPPQREIGHVRDALGGQRINQAVVMAAGDIIQVLHAHDRSDPTAFRNLRGGDVAETEVADQALLLQLGEHRKRRFNRSFGGRMDIKHGPEVDDVQHLEAEVAQVVMDGLGEFFAGKGGDP